MYRPAKNAQTCQRQDRPAKTWQIPAKKSTDLPKHGKRYLPKHAQACQRQAQTCQNMAGTMPKHPKTCQGSYLNIARAVIRTCQKCKTCQSNLSVKPATCRVNLPKHAQAHPCFIHLLVFQSSVSLIKIQKRTKEDSPCNEVRHLSSSVGICRPHIIDRPLI